MGVRSCGATTPAMNADLGAVSMLCVDERRMRNATAREIELGIGIKARSIAPGRCAMTIVFTFPRRLATEEAGSIDSAAMKLVAKKTVPNLLSDRLNLSWKKNVIQELTKG